MCSSVLDLELTGAMETFQMQSGKKYQAVLICEVQEKIYIFKGIKNMTHTYYYYTH